jgi:hypothetical protein
MVMPIAGASATIAAASSRALAATAAPSATERVTSNAAARR